MANILRPGATTTLFTGAGNLAAAQSSFAVLSAGTTTFTVLNKVGVFTTLTFSIQISDGTQIGLWDAVANSTFSLYLPKLSTAYQIICTGYAGGTSVDCAASESGIDSTGASYVNLESQKASYSAFASFTAVAGDIAVLPGSASKTIRVTRVEVSITTSGTAAIEDITLVKRSAADTGGTSAAMTVVPHDSAFAGGSAAPLSYTVAPTPGAAVGTIRGVEVSDASGTLPGANTWFWEFGSGRPASAIVLRGVAQELCVNLSGAVATTTANVSFEYTEE